jgi:hypothetical protein
MPAFQKAWDAATGIRLLTRRRNDWTERSPLIQVVLHFIEAVGFQILSLGRVRAYKFRDHWIPVPLPPPAVQVQHSAIVPQSNSILLPSAVLPPARSDCTS